MAKKKAATAKKAKAATSEIKTVDVNVESIHVNKGVMVLVAMRDVGTLREFWLDPGCPVWIDCREVSHDYMVLWFYHSHHYEEHARITYKEGEYSEGHADKVEFRFEAS